MACRCIYDYADTPLWAGIFMLPLTAGFLVAGPAAGAMSDRFGVRGIASVGMLLFGLSFVGLMVLPIDFPYWEFAMLIALNGIGSGMFAAPNTSAIMGSVLPSERGVVSGMRATFQNSGTALSIGVFFSLMVVGLAHSLPTARTSGLQDQGVPHAVAQQVAVLPPVSTLFAAVLGVNPLEHLLAPTGVQAHLPSENLATITGAILPHLISAPLSTTASRSWFGVSVRSRHWPASLRSHAGASLAEPLRRKPTGRLALRARLSVLRPDPLLGVGERLLLVVELEFAHRCEVAVCQTSHACTPCE